ncbi:MAG TPA: ATP-binding protein [Planctomycetota bacterium]|nr:ATP-binding protein [Planctomycetota bacterium]
MPGELDTAEIRQRQARDIAERLWLASKLKVLSPRGTFNVNDAVDVALFLTERLFRTAGIKLHTRLDPTIPAVDAHMGKVEQTLVNVLVNACEATRHGGVVTVTTEYLQRERRVAVCIADTGEGIPAEVLDRVFEPFYSTRGRLGVGLSAARDLLSGLGGDIGIESTVGEGTKVTLGLPAAAPPEHQSEQRESEHIVEDVG